jgi:hypothetical protein
VTRSSPSSGSESKSRRETEEAGGKLRGFLLVSCFGYSSTMKMERICSSESSGHLRTAQRYDPEEERFIDIAERTSYSIKFIFLRNPKIKASPVAPMGCNVMFLHFAFRCD